MFASPGISRQSMKFTYPPNSRPVDGYTIRRGLHRGGFGEVYYAVSDAGKEVALKLLTHDLDTELRGVRQCLNLKHPNLVTLFDVRHDAEGDTWVVMEYVSGSSLEDVLRAFPNGLPLTEVRDWMAGMLSGTEYLHGRGIIHRDLKPGNVYRENGVVKIGDVGLSKQMGGGRRQHTEAVGTVYYMAPEVAKGQYGPEVDVYSLGVMLYELLTGQLPFDGETTAEILMKHLSSPVDLALVPDNLRGVLAHALEKDPAKRIKSARQFHQELWSAVKFEPLPESAFETDDAVEVKTAQARSRRESPVFESRNGAAPLPVGVAARHLVSDVLSGVREHVRGHVDRSLERERERHQRWQAKQQRKVQKAALKAAARQERKAQAASWMGSNWPWIFLVALIFVPWQRMSWADINETVGIIGLFGGLLFAIDYLTRSDRTRTLVADSFRTPVVNHPASRLERGALVCLLSVIMSGLLTVLAYVGWMTFEPSLSLVNASNMVWLIIGSALAALAVHLVLSVSSQSRLANFTAPSWVMMLAGLGVGAVVAGLGDFLDVRETLQGPARPLFRYLGNLPLVDGGHPTVGAYMVLFGVLLWSPNWGKVVHVQRTYRLRMRSLFWAAGIGYVGALLSGVPVPYAVIWSTVVSATVQIAAPWQPSASESPAPVQAA